MTLSRFWRRRWWDEERARELEDYLAREIDDNIARGMTPDDARRAAHRKLGNTTRIREDIYEMNTMLFLDTLGKDLRYGLRILRRNPTFAAVAILTLALGTGANTAIFQLVNALHLRSLPVAEPEQLVSVGIDVHGKGRVGRGYGGRSMFTEPLWQEIRTHQQAFSSVFAWSTVRWDLATEGEAVFARGLYVSGDYFDALGVRAHAGRVITAADDEKGCASPGAVLSYAFWQTRYGGDPGAIGRTITLDRQRIEIIGVAQRGFFGVDVGRTFDVAIPLCAEPMMRAQEVPSPATGRRDAWWLDIMGRLKPDWTVSRAQAHLASISRGVFEATVPSTYNPEWVNHYLAFTLTATPAEAGVSTLRRTYAPHLAVLLGATGLILLLTCANLANLMLARSSARGSEIAVRLAIGASRRRLIRQMLSESALLAGFGALGGFLLAGWISRTLVVFLDGGSDAIFMDLAPDWRTFAFVATVAAVTCILFGLSPALKATRRDLVTTMQPGARSSDSHEAVTLRRALVIVQVALSMVLVVGALLFVRTLQNLSSVELGFRPDVLVADVDLRQTVVQPAGRRQAFAQVAARIEQIPGVRGAAETLIVPLSGADWNGRIVKDGVVQEGDAHFNEAAGDFFRVLDIPLLAGRSFDDERDRPETPRVAVVNQTFARRFFPNTDPVGQTFQMEAPPGRPRPTYQIVGLVRDAKYLQVRDERTPEGVGFSADDSAGTFLPIAYLAMSQSDVLPADLRIVISADVPAASLTGTVTRAVTEVVPGAAVSYDTITRYIDRMLATERLMAWLSSLFGVLAMVIASVGLYGVMSYTATRRRTEIGIRIALGADPRSVVRMMLGESGLLLALGVVIGVALAVAVLRYAERLLFGLTSLDASSFAAAVFVLVSVSLLAAWFPARGASRLDPTTALREQ